MCMCGPATVVCRARNYFVCVVWPVVFRVDIYLYISLSIYVLGHELGGCLCSTTKKQVCGGGGGVARCGPGNVIF